MPDDDDEDDENEDEFDEEEAMSSSSGSSMTSVVQSPQAQSIEGAYRMEDIDRIIREAKQQKK